MIPMNIKEMQRSKFNNKSFHHSLFFLFVFQTWMSCLIKIRYPWLKYITHVLAYIGIKNNWINSIRNMSINMCILCSIKFLFAFSKKKKSCWGFISCEQINDWKVHCFLFYFIFFFINDFNPITSSAICSTTFTKKMIRSPFFLKDDK